MGIPGMYNIHGYTGYVQYLLGLSRSTDKPKSRKHILFSQISRTIINAVQMLIRLQESIITANYCKLLQITAKSIITEAPHDTPALSR